MKQIKTIIGMWIMAFILLTACTTQSDTLPAENEQPVVVELVENTNTATVVPIEATAELEPVVPSVNEALEANAAPHGDSEEAAVVEDTAEEAAVTQITLSDTAIIVSGEGVAVDGRTATITAAGTYELSGTLTEGQIVIDVLDEEIVQLILNGVDISHSSTAPIYVANGGETIIYLADNSQNIITDGASYIFATAEEDEPNAAVFSHDDLTISGTGSLTVNANYSDGIASKDGLVITSGNITINAVDDGIRGKDYLVVKDGSLTIVAQGDGMKSGEDEDASKGYVAIEAGTISIQSGGDAIQAQTDVLISGGTFDLTTGGGSQNSLAADTSAKGIKAAVNINIDGGTFTINAADDGVHSNVNMVINNGSFTVATGDDGFHADATLIIKDGTVNVTESYEGIESALITIDGGNIAVVSSDDGINVAGGNDGSGFGPGGGGGPGGGPPPGGDGKRPPRGERGGGGGGRGPDTFAEYNGDYYLYINGGYITVNANGDGVDANGAIVMTDGIVIVNGPTEQMNGALDYDGTFTMSGGYFVAVGSSRMAQTADISSSQNALLLNLTNTLDAGTLIHIEDDGGNDLLTFAPSKSYQSISFSSPELSSGTTYTVYYGGSAAGAENDGLYSEASYESGTEYISFTVSEIVTRLGNTGRR